LSPAQHTRPSIRYIQYEQIEEAWDTVIAPWLRACEKEAWRQPHPVAMVVPHAAAVAYIKERLLTNGLSAFGVHFLTPGQLRTALLSACQMPAALAIREDLHLIARMVASSQSEQVVAQSILAEPDAFVKACDSLEGGGWQANGFTHSDVRAIAAAYFGLLKKTGLQTAFCVDRHLREAALTATPCFGELLMLGFTAQHWNQYNLLAAAPHFATNTLLCLPLQTSTQAEIMWQHQWEQTVGSAEPLQRSQAVRQALRAAPYASLAKAAERYVALDLEEPMDPGSAHMQFCMAQDIHQEAAVIADLVMHDLSDPGCERLGVVFASRVSPLAREVGERLRNFDIPHHNIPGYYPGQPPAQWLFENWAEFQATQRLQPYLHFTQTLHWQGLLDRKVYAAVETALMDAFRECMTDDLNVLLHYVTAMRSTAATVCEHLRAWPLLPVSGTFQLFFAAVAAPLQRIGWPPRLDVLQQRATRLGAVLNEAMDREAFLAWLRSVVNVPGRTRPALGREPFARVQMITLDEAAGQTWSHLIFAGMQQGVWPPEASGSAFLQEARIAHLNRSVTVEGRQGEGHEVLRAGYSYLLSPPDIRRRHEQDFFDLLGSVCGRASLTASALAADGSGKAIAPSDLWMRVYYAEHGKLYTDAVRAVQLSETAVYLRRGIAQPLAETVDFPEVRRAFIERRDPQAPFGQYSFRYRQPPDGGLQLSCKAWETACKRPASAWYAHVLSVRQAVSPASQDVRSLTVGTWLHEWINPTPGQKHLRPLPTIAQWLETIHRAATHKRTIVTQAYQQAQRALPDWWQVDWARTRRLARQFAREIAAHASWAYGVGEFTLRAKDTLSLPELGPMPLRGRIDLLLSQQTTLLAEDAASPRAAWVVDFKTGADAPLSKRGLAAGDGLQLALYALALKALGVATVDLSILRPDVPLQPQLNVAAVLEQTELWASLWRMHRSGCLGDRGAVRSAYTFTGHYPLATLPVDPLILEQKWQLTQAALEQQYAAPPSPEQSDVH